MYAIQVKKEISGKPNLFLFESSNDTNITMCKKIALRYKTFRGAENRRLRQNQPDNYFVTSIEG